MKKKNKKKKVTKKQLYLTLIIITIVLVIIYFASWHIVKKKDKLINSYLITSGTIASEIKDINEFSQVKSELPNEYFVIISHTEDDFTYSLEKKLKNIIDKYQINDVTYYLNVTNYSNDDTLFSELNSIFNTKEIDGEPCILYFKNLKLEKFIKLNSLKDIDTFKDLLENNNYEK